ncbi:TPA: type III glutamate--ammonia ligase [Candidatus Poribacteria bacterium]|nr:type III glutamate--ammonia ligase [Candidatus Poribacteria bacterium]HIA67857.1 type III glutamate--ammonia ligase [Candidatus Poribacteria bacterium]HIB99895.1 type III glutamate--ammonia ligase [Candidatus Poribacteria bacterium]
MTLDQVKSLVNENGIEFFLCSFVEMSGAPKAKVVPATHLDDMATEGAGFAGFAAGEMGQGPHDPDMASIPDFDSLTIVPWRKNVAWVTGNVQVNDQPWPYCPRTILQRQLENSKQKGYIFNVGVEAEFMLLKGDENGRYAPWDSLDTLEKPCYDLQSLHRNLDVMMTLIKYMQELGWSPYANDHEDANCQFEINWVYSDALTTADRHTFYKWMVKTIAEEQGLLATFMPKPFANLTGNGAHLHMSLWDEENQENLFLDQEDRNGLSQLAYWFMGGILKHAKALAAVANPLVNSYKRLISGAPRSGATWAPVYITYGGSNRTQMVRIPAPGRIENRSADGAANPYLVMAAMLAAGLDGIENKIDPGERNDDNLYEVLEDELRRREIGVLPRSLKEAVDCLEADEVIKQALGSEYADYYIQVKNEEWRQYHNTVSKWESDNYLGLY